MTTERYEEICKQLNPSIQSLLNVIRRYLQANQASVMVGAGFSKNAIFDPGAKMKDWNELGKDFYEQLYAKKPEEKDLEFKSPVRLASQLASYTSHIELDKIISNSLPDGASSPGPLHIKLMQLPWRDVFTTNYDTLLERTRPQWIRHYDVVKNRDTLVYSKSPRIIKLHGCFTGQHPFIITEEDFRTYPNKHPEFVNTVRQSLIENLFCLVGFSGDDENFLSWIGWLRDVIGKESVMCYHITFSKDKHDSETCLMQERGITPIDLKELPLHDDEGYAEALDFFFTYITPSDNQNEDVWHGSLGVQPYQNLTEDTKTMKSIRESYPGWPCLPADKLEDFEDIERYAPFIGEKFDELNAIEKFKFAKELVWRIQVSYSPLVFRWLGEYLEHIIETEDISKSEMIDMALLLLASFRRGGASDKFQQLDERLKDVIFYGTGTQLHTYLYEKALLYASMLDITNLKKLVHNWKVSAEDTIPALWKANMLTFLGDRLGAKVLLEEANRHVASQFGASAAIRKPMLQDLLQTSLSLIVGHDDIPSSSKSLYLSYVNKLKLDLVNYEKKGKPGQWIVHTFNIGRKMHSWHGGVSGLYGDYVYPCRYIVMREKIGLPFGMPDYDCDVEHIKTFLTPLAKYDPVYVIGCAVRSMSYDLVTSVFTREVIHHLDKNIGEAFDTSSCYEVFSNPQSMAEERIQKQVLIPLISRMCIRFEQPLIRKVFDVVISSCQENIGRYDLYRDELRIIYDCADEQSKIYMLHKCLEIPIPSNKTPWDIAFPECISNSVVIEDNEVQSLSQSMSDKSVGKERVLKRIRIIWRYLELEQKQVLEDAIREWRMGRNEHLAIRTFDFISPSAEEEDMLQEHCEKMVSAFEQYAWSMDNKSDDRDNVVSHLGTLVCLGSRLTSTQLVRVYRHLALILPKVYSPDNIMYSREYIMNERDYYLAAFNKNFHQFIRCTSERMMNMPDEQALMYKQIDEIDDNLNPLLEAKLRFMPIYDLIADKNLYIKINKRIDSKLQYAKDDGVCALIYAMRHNIECQKVFSSILAHMRRTKEESLVQYLQYCFDILSDPKYEFLANSCNSTLAIMLELVQDRDLSFDFKTDVRYFTGRLAGLISQMNVRNKKAANVWEEVLRTGDDDTDVKNGFEQGLLQYANKYDNF